MSIISIFCAILVKKEKRSIPIPYIIQNSTLPVHRSIDGFKWTKNEPGSLYLVFKCIQVDGGIKTNLCKF